MRLQFLHDVEFVLEADRLFLRVVFFALRQHLPELLRAHRQVQALGSRFAVVRAIPDAHGAVARTVHVVHAAVAIFSHVRLFAVGRRLRDGGTIAVRRVVGVDRLLRVLVDGAVTAIGTILHAVGIPLRRLDHFDVQHGPLDDDVVLPEVIVGLLVDHQQLGLVGERLDALDHLVVSLVRDVDLVNLDYPVALAKTGRLARRSLVHLADELAVLAFLRVQIEAVTVEIVPLDDVAEPGARRLIVLE